ncbi:hypothetical protein EfmAA610_18960 [Enterococcus faecium]|nr:hypothetical protein EfmAA610_18960 [Enterococcus faecium]
MNKSGIVLASDSAWVIASPFNRDSLKYNELVRLINESDKQVNDRIDQTNQQIGDLGKLKKMYSNSIDFGVSAASANPPENVTVTYDLIENQNTSAGTLSKGENSFKYNSVSAEVEGGVELYYKRRGIANWLPSNKTLVMTVKLRAGADYSPVDGKLILIRYRKDAVYVFVETPKPGVETSPNIVLSLP